jgi:hypothetical protein
VRLDDVEVRWSPRARHRRLEVPWGKAPRLTVPQGTSHAEVQRLLTKREASIVKQQRRQVPRLGLERFAISESKARTGARVTWKLTFRRLTGAATAARIHLGRPGKSGPITIPLCGPCSSGVTGTSQASATVVRTLLRNGAYANVHTMKNPSGEIRGQITKAAAGG